MTLTPPRQILLVDDHLVVRAGLRAIVESRSDLSVCGEADSEDAAIAQIRALPADLAIVDMALGSQSALTTIKRLLRYRPNLRILVFSMHDEAIYAARSLRAGAHGYVMKGVDTGTLLEAIDTVLSGQIYVSPRIHEAILRGMVTGQRAHSAGEIDTLTQTELTVLQMLGNGQTVKDIAAALGRSQKTVETHRNNIRQKLHLPTSAALLHFATRWVQSDDPGTIHA